MTRIAVGEYAPPCRPGRTGRLCRHYDCMMDRGEELPEGVVGYVDGSLYVPDSRAASGSVEVAAQPKVDEP